jgi:hypothetical protein
MPTLMELQHRLPARPLSLARPESGEEMVADSRATLTPSQLVERKLAARGVNQFQRQAPSAFRPRAK